MAKTGRPSVRDSVFKALPGTIKQVVKKSGTSDSSVRLWLTTMHKAGEIHISAWRHTQGAKQPYYSVGAGEDKPPPPNFTEQEYRERYEKKHPGRVREIKTKSERKRRVKNKLKAAGHSFLLTLFQVSDEKRQQTT